MLSDLNKELKVSKTEKGHEATKLMKAKQPSDQKHSSDTRAKVLNGIHKRTHVSKGSSRSHDVRVA